MASASEGSKVIPQHIDSRTTPGTFAYKQAVQYHLHFMAFQSNVHGNSTEGKWSEDSESHIVRTIEPLPMPHRKNVKIHV